MQLSYRGDAASHATGTGKSEERIQKHQSSGREQKDLKMEGNKGLYMLRVNICLNLECLKLT